MTINHPEHPEAGANFCYRIVALAHNGDVKIDESIPGNSWEALMAHADLMLRTSVSVVTYARVDDRNEWLPIIVFDRRGPVCYAENMKKITGLDLSDVAQKLGIEFA